MIIISGNHMLRRPKHSKIKVVAPKEEEERNTRHNRRKGHEPPTEQKGGSHGEERGSRKE